MTNVGFQNGAYAGRQDVEFHSTGRSKNLSGIAFSHIQPTLPEGEEHDKVVLDHGSVERRALARVFGEGGAVGADRLFERGGAALASPKSRVAGNSLPTKTIVEALRIVTVNVTTPWNVDGLTFKLAFGSFDSAKVTTPTIKINIASMGGKTIAQSGIGQGRSSSITFWLAVDNH